MYKYKYKHFLRITLARNLRFAKIGLKYRYRYYDRGKSGLENQIRSSSYDLGFGVRDRDRDRGVIGLCTYTSSQRGGEREREREESARKMESGSASDVARWAEEGDVVEVEVGGGGNARGGKGGRGGKGKGEGRGAAAAAGGGSEKNREMLVSKALSKLLRHAAESEGVMLDGEGFARLDLVVSLIFFCS